MPLAVLVHLLYLLNHQHIYCNYVIVVWCLCVEFLFSSTEYWTGTDPVSLELWYGFVASRNNSREYETTHTAGVSATELTVLKSFCLSSCLYKLTFQMYRSTCMCRLNINFLWNAFRLLDSWGSEEDKSVGGKYQTSYKIVIFYYNLGFWIYFLGDSRNSSFEDQKQLALLVMETLTVLLQGSNTNAGK